MQRSRTIFMLGTVAAVLLQGAACDGSSPLAPGEGGGSENPGSGSSFHQSNATIESASLSGGDPHQMTLVLGGNVQVRVTEETVIDAGGDLTTLDQVLNAIDAGTPVRIEVDGTIVNGVVNATHIRFETDGSSSSGGTGPGNGSDDGSSLDEVHGIVAAIDLGARTVTLADGRVLRIGSDDRIETDGDFRTLADVGAALAAGLMVRVEADLAAPTGGIREVTSAKFESDQADGPGGDDDFGSGNSGDDLDEVHGIVAAVDLGARTVTLADGRVLRIADDARIETDGDFLTLAQVAAALAGGLEVRVEADLAPATGGVLEATSAKFESDQADGPGDDDEDDGDDNSGPGNGGDDNSGPGSGGDDNSGPGSGGDDNSGPGSGGDDDFDDDEVEGIVASVDLTARTVTTTSGRVIRVATDALIDADGDILTLAAVAQRVASGARVRVEADGSMEGGVFVATLAKFEVD